MLQEIRENPGKGVYIEQVPFYPQETQMCGPAALASVIGYWSRDFDSEEGVGDIYKAKLKGTLPTDMLLFARGKGFEATYYKGSIGDLKEKLSKNIPLILFLNLGFDVYPIGHYIVAVGYNDISEVIIAYSGLDKDMVIKYADLESQWKKTNFSTLLVKVKKK